MNPRHFAKTTPDKVAVKMSDGCASLSFAELEKKANQAAYLFRSHGLEAGGRVAFLLPNCIRYPRRI